MEYTYQKNIGREFIGEAEIKAKIKETAEAVSAEYAEKNPLILGVLKGSFVFIADFIRAMTIPAEVDFMRVKSYFDSDRPEALQILLDTRADLSDYDVLMLEDIIDTGHTLEELIKLLKPRNPKSLKVITLLDKPSRRETDVSADTVLFTVPDVFIVGYGLDYNEFGRNLPYIAEFIS